MLCFAEKIVHFGRYSVHNGGKLCRGKIIRVDSTLVFKAEEPTRIIRISQQEEDLRLTGNFVSYKAVDPSRVDEKKTLLYYEDSSGCISMGRVMRKLENSYILENVLQKHRNETFRKQASKVHYYPAQGKVAH